MSSVWNFSFGISIRVFYIFSTSSRVHISRLRNQPCDVLHLALYLKTVGGGGGVWTIHVPYWNSQPFGIRDSGLLYTWDKEINSNMHEITRSTFDDHAANSIYVLCFKTSAHFRILSISLLVVKVNPYFNWIILSYTVCKWLKYSIGGSKRVLWEPPSPILHKWNKTKGDKHLYNWYIFHYYVYTCYMYV